MVYVLSSWLPFKLLCLRFEISVDIIWRYEKSFFFSDLHSWRIPSLEIHHLEIKQINKLCAAWHILFSTIHGQHSALLFHNGFVCAKFENGTLYTGTHTKFTFFWTQIKHATKRNKGNARTPRKFVYYNFEFCLFCFWRYTRCQLQTFNGAIKVNNCCNKANKKKDKTRRARAPKQINLRTYWPKFIRKNSFLTFFSRLSLFLIE